MKLFKLAAAMGVVLIAAGCTGGGSPLGQVTHAQSPVNVAMLQPMRVTSYRVTVPQTLSVSEENSLDPRADIVWRDDPIGPRHPQVKAVVESGIEKGVSQYAGIAKGSHQGASYLPVVLDIVVQRFHSQTRKVRYSYGGKYEIEYELTVRNANTGEVVVPTYLVAAIQDAPGGVEALAAEQAGRTEKIDNINLIANSIFTQLTGSASQQ